jgi:hypothetical protein
MTPSTYLTADLFWGTIRTQGTNKKLTPHSGG